jgi:phosphopantothenoylcysteine synthetase/decarboxylase
MRFLVTAGSTHEMIDSVRQWGNIFTGNTGLGVARALAEVGEVDLLTSNRLHIAELQTQQPSKFPIHPIGFVSHADLRHQLERLMSDPSRYHAVFMSAAVADYRPVRVYSVLQRNEQSDGTEQWIVQNVQSGKVKSNHPAIAILAEQTEKLVDLFRSKWHFTGLLVKFKLEVGISREALVEIGQKSRISSGAQYLVANTLDMVDGAGAGAFLLSDAGQEWVPRGQLPQRLVQIVKQTIS